MRISYASIALLVLVAQGATAQLTVTSEEDAGAGTLRAALAVATPGTTIEFDLADPGVRTISVVTPLVVPEGVTIDGTTQTGASCATWPPTLLVEIDGGSLAPGEDAIVVTGADAKLRGLVVNSAPGDGIHVGAVAGFELTCSFVGTDATGTLDYGNGATGVLLEGATGAQIGGALVSDRNLISANVAGGVDLSALATGNAIDGNYVGTTASGLQALGNGHGIGIEGPSNSVGAAGAGNLVSGNIVAAIELDAGTATANQIHGNRIGANALGASLPNGGPGVFIEAGAHDNTIGAPGSGNEIRVNGGGGVVVAIASSIGNAIRGNSLAGNASIGIDLIPEEFENPNDAGDPDAGPNRLQNTPVLDAVAYTAAIDTLFATYSVDTDPANATYPITVDFYRADAENEEGEIYLGTATYTESDFAVGSVEQGFAAVGAVAIGDRVVATATDAGGNTSEYSDDAATVVVPEPGVFAAGLVVVGVLARRRSR